VARARPHSQAKPESAISTVEGTNAKSTPPTVSPSGASLVGKVKRAPNILPSYSLGTVRCNSIVSIGV
jgi:hypothetical protein